MIVGWVADRSDIVGGAELTTREFLSAAPDGVTVACYDGAALANAERPPDVWVVHNCTQLAPDVTDRLSLAPVVKFWHDVAPHVNHRLRSWLLEHARNVFCSPLQRDYMARAFHVPGRGTVLPPAMDLQPFRDARTEQRDGTVWVGNMVNHGKGIRQAAEWADRNGRTVRFYGDGPLRPPAGDHVKDWGPLPHEQVPGVLGKAETLLFLPTALEPFGRVVAEAWAAGCQVVTNDLCGAAWWLEHQPDALDTAAQDFWQIVAEVAA